MAFISALHGVRFQCCASPHQSKSPLAVAETAARKVSELVNDMQRTMTNALSEHIYRATTLLLLAIAIDPVYTCHNLNMCYQNIQLTRRSSQGQLF
jgi:hypothetical protein